jgi:8-oxo-dGTP diphosphatase
MKPPSADGRRIQCEDLYGRQGSYDAAEVRFRPAGYGILQHNDRILLSRSRFTGLWDFPGGGVEPFELLGEGMAREFFEETNLKVAADEVVHVAEGYIAMFGHPYHSLRFYFRCHLIAGQAPEDAAADPGEITDLRWWVPGELAALTMHASDRVALQHFFDRR